MLVSARIQELLLLFVFVTSTLSIIAYFIQGGDDYAAGRCNLFVLNRKTLQITGDNKIKPRKMISDPSFVKMKKKETGVRVKYPRKTRFYRENHEAGFVAFNADYRGPRRHPPKNN
ncbi:hypothetical protein OROHE_002049 [Orobanche hederae]